MRLGLLGGSFDPVHAGHVAAARAARRQLALDRVLLLPTGAPPHKPGEAVAPALARLVMVELALLHEEGLYADPRELASDRPSYTIETLEALAREQPDDELFLLLGADSLAGLSSWRRWQELSRLATLVALRRPGWDLDEMLPELPADLLAARAAGRLLVVENPPLAASSSDLRAVLSGGGSPGAGELAPLVLDYARKYALYDQATPSPR